MFTAFVTIPPSSAATTCSATMTPARSCASSVEAARCGVTTTWSSSSRGPVYGSAENTSSAAPASFPDRIASTSASSSTSAPRAALTSRAPSRIRAIASRSIEAAGLVGEGRVERHDVRGAEQLVERLDLLDAEVAEPVAPDERVVGDDVHRQPERAPRDLLSDPPEADHAERLPGQLDSRRSASAPSDPASAPHAPAGCCGRARRSARSSAPPPTRSSTRARSRRRSRDVSRRPRPRCRRRRRHGR